MLNDDKRVMYGIVFLLLAFFLISFAAGWTWGVTGACLAGGLLAFIVALIFLLVPAPYVNTVANK